MIFCNVSLKFSNYTNAPANDRILSIETADNPTEQRELTGGLFPGVGSAERCRVPVFMQTL